MWIYFKSLVNSDIAATITMSVAIVCARDGEKKGERERAKNSTYKIMPLWVSFASYCNIRWISRCCLASFSIVGRACVLMASPNHSYWALPAALWSEISMSAPFHLISDCIEANSNENRFMSKSDRIYLPISDAIFPCVAAAALLCCAWREIFFYDDSVLFHFNFPHDNIGAASHQNAKSSKRIHISICIEYIYRMGFATHSGEPWKTFSSIEQTPRSIFISNSMWKAYALPSIISAAAAAANVFLSIHENMRKINEFHKSTPTIFRSLNSD